MTWKYINSSFVHLQQSHRGSSPAIRTFAPDGRTLEAGACGAPRSPSPLRAASLDVRAAPLAHGSLASLADTPTPSSPRHAPPRCLSPLLMPPRLVLTFKNFLNTFVDWCVQYMFLQWNFDIIPRGQKKIITGNLHVQNLQTHSFLIKKN